MAQLLGIQIRNFRSLVDVTLGQISFSSAEKQLPPMMCFIGENGSGKSSLLDAFAFLADCLREGVESACDKPQRGGFENLRTKGSTEHIQFDLYYREGVKSSPITYHFAIGERNGIPYVHEEKLRQRRKNMKHGQPYPFLDITKGHGFVWSGQSTKTKEGVEKSEIALSDLGKLAITTLGQLTEHERIVGLRKYLENWYLSYFTPELARKLPPAGAVKHLDRTGENLGNYVQFLERNHPESFRAILTRISRRIPGLTSITHKKSDDGRLLLQFNERGYQDPFFQQSMSDGTLKLFAYQMLLEDPEPHSLVGIEEPENGLYHKLMEGLARQFQASATRSQGKTQVILTTHSPYFVDALKPDQVWILKKNNRGETTVINTADIAIVREMLKEGLPLGSLWYSNHLDGE